MITRILCTLAVLLLLLAAPPSSLAQQQKGKPAIDRPIDSEGLTVDAAIGLGRFRVDNLPTPISLMIHNTGKPIEAELVLVPNVDFNLAQTLASLELPTETHKRFAYIRNLPHTSFLLQLKNRNTIYWQRRIDVQTTATYNVSGWQRVVIVDRQVRDIHLGPTKQWSAPTGNEIPRGGERRIATEPMPEWQVPDHPAPLEFADGVVFSNDIDENSISRLQLDALGRYVVNGGMVMLPADLPEFVDRLDAALPLPKTAPTQTGTVTISQAGAGRVVVYKGDIFRDDTVRADLSKAVADYGSPGIRYGMMQNCAFYFRGTSEVNARSQQSVSVLAAYFVIYAILVGPLLLTLFKLKKRKMVTFVGGCVAAFTVGAVFLGTYITNGDGDMLWLSFTELTPTGGAESAIVRLKSAGGRKHELAIEAQKVDIQTLPRSRNHMYWGYNYKHNASFFAYDVKSEREHDDASALIDVPMNPWAEKSTLVTAYTTEILPLEIKLIRQQNQSTRVASPRNNNQGLSFRVPRGKLQLQVSNPNPFPIKNGRLLIGAPVDIVKSNYVSDSYWLHDLGTIAANSQFSRPVTADFATLGVDMRQGYTRNQVQFRGDSSVIWSTPRLPTLPVADRMSGVIMGTVENSPAISIDADKTSFLELDGVHVVYQRVPPENLPKPEEMLPKK
jgi:hypothetical protein